MIYKTCIIGTGSIGGDKDKRFDSGRFILTHAHAIKTHKNILPVGICDTDVERVNRVANRWGLGTSFISHVSMIESIKPDIVIVATPTETHYNILLSLTTFHDWVPKLVICEKPFCENSAQAKKISKVYKDINIPLLINYTRRFDLSMQHFRANIIPHVKVFSCRIIYNRGLYRDGCHAIDLCRYLFGENQEVTKLKTKPIYDLSENDPTVSLHLKHELCDNIVMTAMDGNIASIFEFDILTNSGRYQFTNHGLQLSYWPIENNNAFGDYSALSPIPEISDTALNRALLELLQNAIEYLAGNSALRCVPKDGIMVHEIIRKVGKI